MIGFTVDHMDHWIGKVRKMGEVRVVWNFHGMYHGIYLFNV